MLHAIDLHAQAKGDALPEWLHICPPGPLAKGRDGRQFAIDDAEAAIAATEFPAALDIDHLSMLGGSTEAFGWIDRVEYVDAESDDARAPGFWGHVESFTPEGEDHIRTKRFRFLSPVVSLDYREVEGHSEHQPHLRGFLNFALTNRPNLTLTMLHREHADALGHSQKESAMADDKKAETIMALREELAAERAKAEAHQKARDEELHTLRAAVQTAKEERFNVELNSMIAKHSERGALPPAHHDFYREVARAIGMEKTQAHLEALSQLVGNKPEFAEQKPAGDDAISLNAEEKQVAAELGLSEEAMLATKKGGL